MPTGYEVSPPRPGEEPVTGVLASRSGNLRLFTMAGGSVSEMIAVRWIP